MAFVISNTSPLLALADIGQLELLRRLFEQIIIPPAVRAEVLSEPAFSAVQTAIAAGWISEKAPGDASAIRLLHESLDTGEAEAIALAQETGPQWIVLDDLAARHTAEALGLPVIGALGVLLLGKTGGHITELKPLLDQLRNSGLHMSDTLYQHVLQSAGEAE